MTAPERENLTYYAAAGLATVFAASTGKITAPPMMEPLNFALSWIIGFIISVFALWVITMVALAVQAVSAP